MKIKYQSFGMICGIGYFTLMAISIPTLIFLDSSFSSSLSNFDPLSHLSSSEFSSVYYRIILMLGGLLAFGYIHFSFIPSRLEYNKLYNWKFGRRAARFGAIGQIAVSIFDESYFPLHLFATIALATGYVTCILMICLNLDDQLNNKIKFRYLIHSGIILSILTLMNTIYFRYSNIRGIWQLFIMYSINLWYVYEYKVHKQNKHDFNNLITNQPKQLNKIILLMIVFGIYLLIFAYLLYAFPSTEPWSCDSPSDKRCATPNIISLIIAGVILLMFSFNYRLQIKMQS